MDWSGKGVSFSITCDYLCNYLKFCLHMQYFGGCGLLVDTKTKLCVVNLWLDCFSYVYSSAIGRCLRDKKTANYLSRRRWQSRYRLPWRGDMRTRGFRKCMIDSWGLCDNLSSTIAIGAERGHCSVQQAVISPDWTYTSNYVSWLMYNFFAAKNTSSIIIIKGWNEIKRWAGECIFIVMSWDHYAQIHYTIHTLTHVIVRRN